MILIALDFWSIIVYCFFASVLFFGYRLTWRLAYFSEGLIVSLARAGLYSMARGLLFALIGYTDQTYQRSRFIIWNQVHVRFFMLWGTTFLLTGLILLFRIQPHRLDAGRVDLHRLPTVNALAKSTSATYSYTGPCVKTINPGCQ